ncbi:MAG: hypothetical protein KGS72_17250 [Cyanobacteria bacterium REEB67]|nr:hypothetical protein [Cyanobacteria bacterium REEB67]
MSNKSSQPRPVNESQSGETSHLRVGELLVEAMVVSSAEMTEAIQVSKRLGVPIGRVLTMSGCVREQELEAALQVQQLVRRGEIPLQAGLNSLQRVHEMKIGLAESLAEEDLQPDLEHDPHKLAELLVDSNIVSALQMERAVQASVEMGVPLGSTLVLQGFLSEAVLPSLVRIQNQITEGTISREEGLKEIQETFMLWVKADESLRKPLKHEEAPNKSDLIGRDDVHVLPASISTPMPAPNAAQNTAQNTAQNAPPTAQAGKATSGPASGAVRQESEKGPEDNSNVRLVDLLKHSGVFSQADVQRRYDVMLKDPVRSAKFFLELGLVEEEDLKNALRSHSLMQRGLLSKDEAALALRDARTAGFARELSSPSESSEKVKRYMDKDRRSQMSKVLGGALFGALVAGITLSKRK